MALAAIIVALGTKILDTCTSPTDVADPSPGAGMGDHRNGARMAGLGRERFGGSLTAGNGLWSVFLTQTRFEAVPVIDRLAARSCCNCRHGQCRTVLIRAG